jgi:hypothetical protein
MKNKEVFSILLRDDDGKYNITKEVLLNLFGLKRGQKAPLVKPSDEIEISKEHSKFVKNKSITTVGIFIFNKLILEPLEVFGYINKTIDGKIMSTINDKVGIALTDGNITPAQCAEYIDNLELLGGGLLSYILNPSANTRSLRLPAKAKKALKDNLEASKEKIANGDLVEVARIEKEVTGIAWDELKKENPEALDMFEAKVGLSFDNNYKTMFIMKGPVQDNVRGDGNFNVITSSLDNGISKDDFAAFADSGVTGAYSKGKLTGVSGYAAKIYNILYQSVELGDSGSDCGTKKTVPILITPNNKNLIGRYLYHMVKGKPELLTPETIDQYVGKVIQLRSPLICQMKEPKYCNICYGELAYKVDKKNVGMTYSVVANDRMNADLKKFHDVSIKTGTITTDMVTRYIGG